MKRKVLALALAICLLLAALPVRALPEEVVPDPVETAVPEIAGELGALGLVAEGEDVNESPELPEPPETALPRDDEAAQDDAEEPAADPMPGAASRPAFIAGYARALAPAAVLDDAGAPLAESLPEGATVYAYDRSLEDRLLVCFDSPGGVVNGWVDAALLRPLEAAEADAFAAAAALRPGVAWFDAERTLPLDWVGEAPAPREPELRLEASEGGTPEPEPEPTALTLAVSEAAVGVGEVRYLIPAFTDGKSHPYTASIEGEGVLEFQPDNGLLGLAEGTATVRFASAYGEAVCAIRVLPAPEALGLSAEALVLGETETAALTATLGADSASAITWDVDDPAIASVSPEGLVTGVAPGDTVVRAATFNGLEATCAVHVGLRPDAVRFSAETFNIGLGEKTDALQVVLGSGEGDYAGAYTVRPVGKARYVKVTPAGVLEGIRLGTQTVEVTTYNGLTATCQVTVKPAPASVTPKPATMTLGYGETARLKYKVNGGAAGRATFHSYNKDIVTVDARTGVLTAAFKKGTAKIRIRTYNKKVAYAYVTVKKEPKTLTVTPAALMLGVGQTLPLTAAIDSGAAGKISYSTADGEIATVTGAGAVTGVAEGETEIIVRTYNGLEEIRPVTVKPEPTAVTLPVSDLTLGVGDKFRLRPDVGDSVGGYTYTTKNAKLATVSAKGVIKGIKPGKAAIVVKTYNGKKAKLPVTVVNAPGKVTARTKTRELGLGESFKLGYKLPAGTASTVTFKSLNPEVLEVDAATGVVTALKPGGGKVEVRTHNGKTDTCAVKVYPAPIEVETDVDFVELGVGMTYPLQAAPNAGSRSAITYESVDENIAAVSKAGVITATGAGTTIIRAKTYLLDVYAEVSVTVWPAPESVDLETTELTVNVDETFALEPILPEGTMTVLTYTSSDPELCAVTADGVVTTILRGSVTITVATHNGKTATLQLTILDPWYPTDIKLTGQPEYLLKGSTHQVTYDLTPEDARPRLVWKSSNKKVAKVSQSGLITAVNIGQATITAISEKNSKVKLEIKVIVQTKDIVLVIPKRTTKTSGIDANLARIEAIRVAAVTQVKNLQSSGKISAADASKRRSIINNAFKDYAFPWMTPSYQKYWRAANSEGGAKDFKTGKVYYGMPYTSGSLPNRAYNVAKALKEKRYTKNGKYYLLNRNNLLYNTYVGNDCSCFVDAAIWGTNSRHSNDRTSEIAVSSAYRTIRNTGDLRPGDLLCKGYAHVVMFLYFTNAQKTQMMIIENGGAEPGTNTVHCDIHNLSYYTSRGYKVRRLASLG